MNQSTIQNEETQQEVEPSVYGAIDATKDLEDAIEFGGLDFEVDAEDIRVGDDSEPTPGFKAIRRLDTGDVFAVPTNSYKVVQNREVLDFAMPLIRESQGTFTRVGTFNRGAGIFAFATLPEKIVLPAGEEFTSHIVVQSSHDGSTSVKIRFLLTDDEEFIYGVPVVSGVRTEFAFRHTQNVQLKMHEVEYIVSLKNQFLKTLDHILNEMCFVELDRDRAEELVNKLLDIDVKNIDDVSKIRLNNRDQILGLYSNSKLKGKLKESVYGLYKAVVEYRNAHSRVRVSKKTPNPSETRTNSVLNGVGMEDMQYFFSMLIKEFNLKPKSDA